MIRAAVTVLLLALGGTLLTAEASAREILIEGVVVDEHHNPQGGVRIEAVSHRQSEAVVTAPNGRYAIKIAVGDSPYRKSLGLRASREGGGLVGRGFVDLHGYPGARVRAEAIVLRRPLRVPVRVREGEVPVAGARIEALIHAKTAVAWATTGDTGVAILQVDPTMGYTITLADARWARTTRAVTARELARSKTAPLALSLAAGPRRDVRVTVLDETSNLPIENAELDVQVGAARWHHTSAYTDAEGVAALRGLPAAQAVQVTVREGNLYETARIRIDPHQFDATTHLKRAPHSPLRIQLAPGSPRPPPESEVVFWSHGRRDEIALTLDAESGEYLGESSGFGANGFMTIGTSHAALVHGRRTDDEGPFIAQDVVLTKAAAVEIALLDADGAPMEGERVRLQGSCLAESAEGRLVRPGWMPLQTTDAEGLVQFRGVFFEGVSMTVAPSDRLPAGFKFVHAKFEGGTTTRITRRLPAPVPVVVDVTVDGAPGLRGDMKVFCNNRLVRAEVDARTNTVSFAHVAQEKDKGIAVRIVAEGFVEEPAYHEEALPPEGLRLRVGLHTALELGIHVQAPNDEYIRPDTVQLHRWHPEHERWEYENEGRSGFRWPPPDKDKDDDRPEPTFRMDRLTAGRYRVVHVPTGASSGAFEIDPTKTMWHQTLEVPPTHVIQGRLTSLGEHSWEAAIFSDPHGAPGLRFQIFDGPRIQFRQRGWIAADGRFSIEVPSDRTTRIQLTHPLIEDQVVTFTPDSESPMEIRTRPRSILTIPVTRTQPKLSPGGRVKPPYDERPYLLRWESDFNEIPSWAWRDRTVDRLAHPLPRVWRWDEDAEPSPKWVLYPRVFNSEASLIHVGVTEPGAHVLLLDFDNQAPLIVRTPPMDDGNQRLPTHALDPGASARVRWFVPAGERVASVGAQAEPLDADRVDNAGRKRLSVLTAVPEGRRGIPADDQSLDEAGLLVLPGLAPGLYRLQIWVHVRNTSHADRHPPVETVIEVRGKQDVEVVADFRSSRDAAKDPAADKR